jgi:hypothetical protein
MNASDPEYQIVVALSENLVPDVCTLIMGFLEDIHAKRSKQEWKEKMGKINEEYLNNKLPERGWNPNIGYLAKTELNIAGFMFNWRTDAFPGWISNLKGFPGCETPNYF